MRPIVASELRRVSTTPKFQILSTAYREKPTSRHMATVSRNGHLSRASRVARTPSLAITTPPANAARSRQYPCKPVPGEFDEDLLSQNRKAPASVSLERHQRPHRHIHRPPLGGAAEAG